MAAIVSTGIGSGLDVDGIVSKLMAVESQPLTRLAKKEAAAQAKISAYGNLNSALSSFQSALSALSTPKVFNSVSATPTDASILTATATSSAVAGNYNVNVTQLAAAQTVSTAGRSSSTATIGGGDSTILSFQFGTISGGTLANGTYTGATFTQDPDRTSGSVTIDSSNNSLQGIRDAVNAANIGVVATIVSDGSATPAHLVFTSSTTGASSSMKISVTGRPPTAQEFDDGISPEPDADLVSLLGYDPEGTQSLTQNSAALNTQLTVNGIAVNSPTSAVTDAVQGVTISALKLGSTSVTVARSTGEVTAAVTAFVKAYNDLNSTFKSLAGYNADTGTAGTLIGDASVRDIQAQVRKTMSQSLTGLSTSVLSLPQIGIEFQKDGTLTMDSTKFNAALTKSSDDIAGLFSTFGKATDSLVTFASSTTATKAGNYGVNITQLATHGSLIGSIDLDVSTAVNTGSSFSVTLDGTTAIVPLQAGNYTQTQLASMLQSAINTNSAFVNAGSKVAVTVVNNKLMVESERYGSASKIDIVDSESFMTRGMFDVITRTDGLDVAGTIDGQVGGGSGQVLSAALGSNAEGLKVTIAGGALGARGTVAFSQGYADRLSKLIDGIIGTDGIIKSNQAGLSASVKDITKSVDSFNLRLATIEKNYRAQFTALDVAISNMQSTSTYLTQQLAIIAAQSN